MVELPLTPWILPGLVGAAVAVVAAVIALRRRARPGARELVALSAAVGWWCLLQPVILLLPSLEGKVLASKIQYLGISATPVAWFWFAAAYTSRSRRIPPAGWALLVAPEAATLLLAWTNEWHGLVWRRLELVPAGGVRVLAIEYGAWFRVHVVYIYLLILAGTGLLVASLSQAVHQWRRLAAAVVASLLPVAVNLSYLLGLVPWPRVDLTPAGLALGGLVLAWSLLREDLLDLPPVARARILEAVPDGIVVLERSGRVIDMNSAAGRLLGVTPGERLGEPFFLPGRSRVPAEQAEPRTTEREGRVLEVSERGTDDVPGGGTVLVVRDVTEQQRLHRELRHLGEELLQANQELTELANTDELTGLSSRRHFLQTLRRELLRAARYRHPLALLLMDVDRFKEINDRLGHATGDAVLRMVAGAIREGVREVDVAGRLGGDELAVALPETDGPGGEATARRLLAAIRERALRTDAAARVSVTVSMGLVVAEEGSTDMEALLHQADLALYRAKAGGRDRVSAGAGEGSAPADEGGRPA